MNQEEWRALAARVAEGKVSVEELRIFNLACESFQENPVSWTNMESDLARMEQESLEKFWHLQVAKPRFKLWPSRLSWASAAAAVLLIGGLWFFLLQSDQGATSRQNYSKNEISPGRNTAVLRLANGKTIQLSEQKTALVIDASSLKYSDGEELVVNGEKGAGIMHISTPRGGQYKVILPDSSEVWLNAASSMQFPNSFASLRKRNVSLQGEAYFEISKNKNQPFIVSTKHQTIEVFGTHFNVSEYADEQAKTTLLEGSVQVNKKILIPGQQAEILGDGSLQVKSVDAFEAIAWKNGKFSFEREEIGSIMKKIERWYDVEVSYKDDVRSVRLTGSLSRFENVSKLLNMLENTREVRFKLEGKKIIVSK